MSRVDVTSNKGQSAPTIRTGKWRTKPSADKISADNEHKINIVSGSSCTVVLSLSSVILAGDCIAGRLLCSSTSLSRWISRSQTSRRTTSSSSSSTFPPSIQRAATSYGGRTGSSSCSTLSPRHAVGAPT
ncbi:hypothetical protein OE88DRAFT_516328 [Heliocybe sulcata]|uniref:Uncharacterized protein n=1 Tax=Heliocybe sulcata TaxID=5364 RepID=A0A5C3MVK0_9AGAM|nr:hypothetical protein OE88DRAFT_516328 [Heliocybe sulcata]